MIKAKLEFHEEITEEHQKKLHSYFHDLEYFSNDNKPPRTVVITVSENTIRTIKDSNVIMSAILEFSDFAKITTFALNPSYYETRIHN